MGPKKIFMKSSAKELIARSTVSKKKVLPKLKVILANPYKPKYETLIDSELSQFRDLISSEIKSSRASGILFARQNNIKLGLGASLRAIKNNQASCVLVSRSIKPKFIIDQIGSFTKQTNDSVPVFVVDDWDTMCVNLFGVRALVVVFPLSISGELGRWIAKRTLPSEEKQRSTKDEEPGTPILPPKKESPIDLSAIYLTKQSNNTRSFVPDVVVKRKQIESPPLSKDWTGDFISFSNQNETDEEAMDMVEVDEEFGRKQDKALKALEKMVKSRQKVDVACVPKSKTNFKENPPKPLVNKKIQEVVNEEWEDDPSYISLEVHKIQPNPNRKPKNKRKKKKQNKNP